MMARVRPNLATLWLRLTEPASSVSELDRRQVRLLSSLLVFFIPTTLVIVMLWGIVFPEDYRDNRNEVYIAALIAALLGGAYVLNRSGRYSLAALLTVTTMALAVYILALTDPSGAIWLVYLVIPIVLSSALLPIRAALAFVAGNLAVLLVLPVIFRQLVVSDMPTDFAFLTAGLTLLVAHHRNQLEQDRRRALARSEERFAQTFRSSPVAIVISTLAEGRMVDVNEHFLRLVGYHAGEIIGRKSTDLNIFQTIGDRTQQAARLREAGALYNVEARWRTRSGHLLDMLTSAEIIELDGEPCIVGMGIDITQLKQAERELRDKERIGIELRKERELGEIKRRFMITAAHEFRTPLAIILASSEIVEMYADRISPERRTESFATIRAQVISLGEMLDDMRMILDVEGESVAFDPAPHDLARLCAMHVEEIQSSLGAKHKLVYTHDGDCTAITLDSNLFERIIKSLLSNAIKFSRPGSEVRVHVWRCEKQASLSVSDDGIGIPAADQPRIFDAYHRAANAINIPGIGLGLAIVRNFVKLHEGQVTFTSEEGKGTTFVVTLPVQTDS
jgi:PAS domain S-box-containing protein